MPARRPVRLDSGPPRGEAVNAAVNGGHVLSPAAREILAASLARHGLAGEELPIDAGLRLNRFLNGDKRSFPLARLRPIPRQAVEAQFALRNAGLPDEEAAALIVAALKAAASGEPFSPAPPERLVGDSGRACAPRVQAEVVALPSWEGAPAVTACPVPPAQMDARYFAQLALGVYQHPAMRGLSLPALGVFAHLLAGPCSGRYSRGMSEGIYLAGPSAIAGELEKPLDEVAPVLDELGCRRIAVVDKDAGAVALPLACAVPANLSILAAIIHRAASLRAGPARTFYVAGMLRAAWEHVAAGYWKGSTQELEERAIEWSRLYGIDLTEAGMKSWPPRPLDPLA